MDKNQYIDKCMALLNDTKVYKPCKDTTKKLQRDIQESLQRLNREHGTSRLYDWSKLFYNKLLPTGNSSPAPRFYGLPKIHKANCPMCPIVSACGMATYQLAKCLTKILQYLNSIDPHIKFTIEQPNMWMMYSASSPKETGTKCFNT